MTRTRIALLLGLVLSLTTLTAHPSAQASAAKLNAITLSSDASGAATAFSLQTGGRITQMRYVPDATTPLATGTDLTITDETTGAAIATLTDIGLSAFTRPFSPQTSFYRQFTGTDPAANVEISEVVPAGMQWRILSMWFAFTTDANVATRIVNVNVDNGGAAFTYYRQSAQTTQTASQSVGYMVNATGVTSSSSGNAFTIPYPQDLWLMPGSRITTVTANRQVTDNFGAAAFLVEERYDHDAAQGPVVVSGRIKVVVAQGGASKLGTLYVWTE